VCVCVCVCVCARARVLATEAGATVCGGLTTNAPHQPRPTHTHTHLHRSLCHVGTFLYVSREVTSNMMMAHWPWM
jgi:hypothetical protein